MPKKDGRANLKVPRVLFDELSRLAEERDTTAARLAQRALREFLERCTGPVEREVVRIDAERRDNVERAILPRPALRDPDPEPERAYEAEGFNQEREW